MNICDTVHFCFVFYVLINTIGFTILGSIKNKAESKKANIKEVIRSFNDDGYLPGKKGDDINNIIYVLIYHMILSQFNNINLNIFNTDNEQDDEALYKDIIKSLSLLYQEKGNNENNSENNSDRPKDFLERFQPQEKDSTNIEQQLLIAIINMIKNDSPFYNQFDLFNGKKKRSYGFYMFVALLSLPPITMYISKVNEDLNSVKYMYLFSFIAFPIFYFINMFLSLPIYKIMTCGSKMYSIGYHALFTGFFGFWIWFWANQGWGNRELGEEYINCGIKGNLVKKNFNNKNVNNIVDIFFLSIFFFGGAYSVYCGMEIYKDEKVAISKV